MRKYAQLSMGKFPAASLFFFFSNESSINTPYSQMADTREKTGA